MPIHAEVLRAARRIASRREDWTFTPAEIVLALPHLNERSVRTHVVSRCCVNAPKHHPHRWGYFKRVGRGRYQVLSKYRRESRSLERRTSGSAKSEGSPAQVAETSGRYAAAGPSGPHGVIHAIVTRDHDGDMYVAECLEIAVATQGRTLDELVALLEEAVSLHLEDEEPIPTRGSASPRLSVILEVPLSAHAGKT
jgi:predicted RNase H-like HicB family nuclease